MIKSVGGGKYEVFDHKGKKALSKPLSKEKAVKRLQQIEWFKNHTKGGK